MAYIADDTKSRMADTARLVLDSMQAAGMLDCLVHFSMQNPDGAQGKDAVSITAIRAPASCKTIFANIMRFFSENWDDEQTG